jgi:hypothetical protein
MGDQEAFSGAAVLSFLQRYAGGGAVYSIVWLCMVLKTTKYQAIVYIYNIGDIIW